MNHGPSENRRSLSEEILSEAIDRNRQKHWTEYAETFDFAIRDDGVIEVSTSENGQGRLVELSGGAAIACTCYSHREAVGRDDCRHMRAVDAHPRL